MQIALINVFDDHTKIHFLHKVQLHKLIVIQSLLNLVLSNGIQIKSVIIPSAALPQFAA